MMPPVVILNFAKVQCHLGFSLRGLKIVVDCAHGATYYVAPAVFDELGAEVIHMGCRARWF